MNTKKAGYTVTWENIITGYNETGSPIKENGYSHHASLEEALRSRNAIIDSGGGSTTISKVIDLDGVTYSDEDYLNITWTVNDLLDHNTDLTLADARNILRLIERRHDASIGMNWTVLDMFIDDYLESNNVDSE